MNEHSWLNFSADDNETSADGLRAAIEKAFKAAQNRG
jgi:hypothetical protein